MKKILKIILHLIITNYCYGQGYFNQWYFGDGASMHFNSGAPVVTNNGSLHTAEGCATVSDFNGNLLFYTDGSKIWNRNHIQMPNGIGLMGNNSTTQSALIVPMPGDSLKYYVFTMQEWQASGDLRYSIVDMSLNGGYGDIAMPAKNILLGTTFTEKLVAVGGTCEVWVLCHKRGNNNFYAFPVNGSGVGSPVISGIGSVHSTTTSPNGLTGSMKVSPNGSKIGLATLDGLLEVLDFNIATGTVSNPVKLPITPNFEGYSVVFSPDNSKVYFTEGNGSGSPGVKIFQYNLSSGIPASIISSKTYIASAAMPLFIVSDMQRGPDNKIYITRQGTNFLDAINSPNNLGLACNYMANAVNIGGNKVSSGLPNAIVKLSHSFGVNLGTDTSLCQGQSLTLNNNSATSYTWSNGALSPSITVTGPGNYWLQATDGQCSGSDSIRVTYQSYPNINLGNDSTLCQGQSLILHGPAASSYAWSNGAATPSLTVNNPGTYWLTAANGKCADRDSISITYNAYPHVNVGNDSILCQGQSLVLNGSTASSYTWSNGATTPSITVYNTGTYSLIAANGRCTDRDSVSIIFNDYPDINFGNDTSLCFGQSLALMASASSYTWSNGSGNASITVSDPGTYWLMASNAPCTAHDSINIVFDSSCEIEIEMPNVFTPNHDGANDIFKPSKFNNILNSEMLIYNRWGEQLFQTKDVLKGWNGSYHNILCPAGTYYWILKYDTILKESKTLSGFLTLLQ